MADFKTRIDDLTGFASTDDTALSDWLSAGARTVLNILPIDKLARVAGKDYFTSSLMLKVEKLYPY